MLFFPLLLCLFVLLVSATNPRATKTRRDAPSPNFVSASGTNFQVNGSEFRFIGTNAYWLTALNTVQDMEETLGNMSAAGIKVVRTWGFNDVEAIPVNGTWFQLIANGTTTVNTGPNGLQKLDQLLDIATNHGIYVIISLTNNWNPRPLLDNISDITTASFRRRDVSPDTNNSLPRNYLSNDYGGMDAYVRAFGVSKFHDEFYTNQTILNAFMNYTTQVVNRYVNHPNVFSWELANDPRCNSSVPATPNCNTQTITQWHSVVAQHVASLDHNHLVSSGNQGFLCPDCPKLFPTQAPPIPQASPAPGERRAKREPLTTGKILRDRVESWRKTREKKKRDGDLEQNGVRIRGRWASTPTRRQEAGVGSAFDGSQGVDSQDILNIPEIGLSTFQLFPDQNQYGVPDPNLPAFNNTVQIGINWIQQQAQTAQSAGKPVALTGFGLVTQANAADFVPFNATLAPFGTDEASPVSSTSGSLAGSSFGVSLEQQLDAYNQWLQAGISSGVSGMMQYQWGQSGLSTAVGTTISPNVTGISDFPDVASQSPTVNSTGQSPNDGYSTAGIGQDSVQAVLTDASQQVASG